MPIMKQDKHDLDQMHSDWSERYCGCKEDYFACLYLKNKFRCDVPELAPRIGIEQEKKYAEKRIVEG